MEPITNWTDTVFEDTTVVLDGAIFTRCVFRRCELAFAGEAPFSVVGSVTLDNCTWNFQGAAERTIDFLRRLRYLDPELLASLFEDDEEAPPPPTKN